MRDLKYIIVLIGGYEVAVVFNGLLTHSAQVPKDGRLISAGFCDLSFGRFMEIKVSTQDKKASSLPNNPPRENDYKVIQQTLNKNLF